MAPSVRPETLADRMARLRKPPSLGERMAALAKETEREGPRLPMESAVPFLGATAKIVPPAPPKESQSQRPRLPIPPAAPRDATANIIPSDAPKSFEEQVQELPQPTVGPRTYQTATVPKLGPSPREKEEFKYSLETPKHIGQEGYQLQDIARDVIKSRGDFAPGKPAGVALDLTLLPGSARAGAAARELVEKDHPVAAGAVAAASILPFTRGPIRSLFKKKDAAQLGQEFAERFKLAAQKPVPPDLNPDDYANIAKFALDPAGEQRLRSEVSRVVNVEGLHPKQRVSWDETREIAESLGLNKIDLDPRSVSRLSGPEMLAVRNVISNNVDALEKSYQQRAKLLATMDPEGVRAIDQSIAAVESQNQTLLSRFVKSRSSTGRDLNNLKILANRTMEPVTWMTKAQQLLGEQPLTEPMRLEISRLVNSGDRAGLVRYIASLREPVKWTDPEFWTTLRKAGLLLNVPTHLRNITSNLTKAALKSVSDAPATLVDAMASVVTGQRTKHFAPIATARASLKGAREGVAIARNAMRGLPDAGQLRKLDIPHETNFQNPFLDGYTKLSFRAMGAADKPFKQAALQGSIAEQSRVIARAEGLKGEAFLQRAAELAQNPTNEMALRAIADAEHATFQNPSIIGRAAQGLKRATSQQSKIAGAALDIVVPFTNTPGALAGKIAEYSPLGFLAAPVDALRLYRAVADKADNAAIYTLQKKLSERAGRATTGSVMPVLIGFTLASQGRMTGSTPDERSVRDQWNLEGKQGDAVLVNGRWWRVTGISPVGNLMAFGAQLYHNYANPELSGAEATVSTATGMAKTLKEQTFLRGIAGVTGAIDRPSSAMREVSGQVGSFVPSAVGAAARAIDPQVRRPESPGEAIRSRIPGLSKTVDPLLTQFGEPVEREPSLGKRTASAFLDIFSSRPDRTASDPVIRELSRVGATIGRLSKKKQETDQQYNERQRIAGALLRQLMGRIIEAPDYQQAPDNVKKMLLERATASLRSGVTRAMIPPSVPQF